MLSGFDEIALVGYTANYEMRMYLIWREIAPSSFDGCMRGLHNYLTQRQIAAHKNIHVFVYLRHNLLLLINWHNYILTTTVKGSKGVEPLTNRFRNDCSTN